MTGSGAVKCFGSEAFIKPRRHTERHANAIPPSKNDELVCLLSRAFLNYTVVLQDLLSKNGLAPVKPGMGHVLFALFAEESLSPTDLIARTGLAGSSVTEMTQRMEKAGLIKRSRDREDRRMVRLSLTPAARELEPKLRETAMQIRTVMELGFSASEAQRLRAGLARVVENFHRHFLPASDR